MLKSKRSKKVKPAVEVRPQAVQVPIPPPLTDEQKRSRTEAVMADIQASLARNGCELATTRWIDEKGCIQCGMSITVIEPPVQVQVPGPVESPLGADSPVPDVMK